MRFVEVTLEFRTNLSFIFDQEMMEILIFISAIHSCCLVLLFKRVLSDRDAGKKIQVMADITGIWYNLFASGEVETEKSTKNSGIGLRQK